MRPATRTDRKSFFPHNRVAPPTRRADPPEDLRTSFGAAALTDDAGQVHEPALVELTVGIDVVGQPRVGDQRVDHVRRFVAKAPRNVAPPPPRED